MPHTLSMRLQLLAAFLVITAPAFAPATPPPQRPQCDARRASLRLNAFLEFRASELTLERFVGEVSVTEVTDWEYSGELANPLDPAQPARTKEDVAGATPLRAAVTPPPPLLDVADVEGRSSSVSLDEAQFESVPLY